MVKREESGEVFYLILVCAISTNSIPFTIFTKPKPGYRPLQSFSSLFEQDWKRKEGKKEVSLDGESPSIDWCLKDTRKWKKKKKEKGRETTASFSTGSWTSPLCFPVAASWFVGCLSFSPLTHADWSGSQPTPFTLCRRPYFFFPLPSPFFLSLFFFFSLPLFTSCPRDTLSSRHPFHAIPLPLRHSQNTSRRFFTLRDHSIGSRDIDVLTESRGDRRGGGGCLWIGSFRPYRPFPPPSLDFYSLWPTRVFAPANHPSKSCSKSFSNNFIVVVRDSDQVYHGVYHEISGKRCTRGSRWKKEEEVSKIQFLLDIFGSIEVTSSSFPYLGPLISIKLAIT